MTVNQRIIKTYESLNITQYRFAKETNITTATLNHIALNFDSMPSLITIQKILNRYKNLNARWLIEGKGEMWEKPSATEKKEVSEPPPQYGGVQVVQVTEYIEKECSATGGTCYFDALKRANEEIEALKKKLNENNIL